MIASIFPVQSHLAMQISSRWIETNIGVDSATCDLVRGFREGSFLQTGQISRDSGFCASVKPGKMPFLILVKSWKNNIIEQVVL